MEMETEALSETHGERQTSPYESSSFEESTSSSEKNYDSQIPLLVSIESPIVSAFVTVLNSTVAGRRAFANYGEDVRDHIKYDPEWWRNMPAPYSRAEKSEEDWRLAVRTNMQILSAFAAGNMKRALAGTGELESLFRVKRSRDEEPVLGLPSILKLIAQVPEFSRVLVSDASIEGEIVPLVPVPVPALSSGVQRALDNTFWTSHFEDGDDIPCINHLTDVFVVSCSERNLVLDYQIWPERYLARHAPRIEQETDKLRAVSRRRQSVEKLISQLSQDSRGEPVAKALQVASEVMKVSGETQAAEELSARAREVSLRISELQTEFADLEQQLENWDQNLLLDVQQDMTPYSARGLLWPESNREGPVIIFRDMEGDSWHFVCNSIYYRFEWEDVVKYAVSTEGYLVFYERETEAQQLHLAPSVDEFIKSDDEALLAPSDDDSEESIRLQSPETPGSTDPKAHSGSSETPGLVGSGEAFELSDSPCQTIVPGSQEVQILRQPESSRDALGQEETTCEVPSQEEPGEVAIQEEPAGVPGENPASEFAARE